MEFPQAPRVRKPPDYCEEPVESRKARNITIDNAGHVTIAPEKEEEGYDGLQLDFEAFHHQMTSSWAHLESITVEYSGSGIWKGSPPERKLWQFCQTMKTMPVLKDLKLKLTDVSCYWAGPVSVLLSKGTSLLNFTLDVLGMSEEDAKSLVDVLLQNQTLQMFNLTLRSSTYDSSPVSMEQMCRYLKSPTNVLAHLEILAPLSDTEVRQLAGVLGSNTCLMYLRFSRIEDPIVPPSGVGDIAEALHSNTALKTLVIRGTLIRGNELKKLVDALVPSSQPNASLSHLDLTGCRVEKKGGIQQLTVLIKCNTSLVYLSLENLEEVTIKYRNQLPETSSWASPSDFQDLLVSLQSNRTLQHLNLSRNDGIAGKKILDTINDLLLHNHTLMRIDLHGTPLEYEGHSGLVFAEQVFAELRKRNDVWCAVENMVPVSPNSARIFLCGNGEAGKTTLCQKWERKKKRDVIANIFRKENLLASARTRGIEVHKLVWNGMNISVWDMAGQEEYHSFHDLVVPNDSATGGCCMYFIVCNPYKQPLHNIEVEIHYWLKFVSSNTRSLESYRPNVTILMTHFDLWQNDPILMKRLTEIIVKLKKTFNDHLAFDEEKEFVAMDNGKGTTDALAVKRYAQNYLKTLLTKVPKVLKATMDVQSIIAKWNAKNPHRPFVDWETFSKLCEEVDELKPVGYIDGTMLKKKKQYVATSLHEGGHIMYYEDLSTIIMNPQWFCHNIMGNILFKCSNLNPDYSMISNGTISRKHLEEVFLDSLDSKMYNKCFDDSLSIMMKLQICYEDADGNIMIPSLFSDGSVHISHWPPRMVSDVSSYHYIGTSLASKEPTATMLTPGFFPRLQVYLEKFVPEVAKLSYKALKDTISFTHRDSDVHIEYKNDRIDILSRSLSTEGYKLHEEVIKSINTLRSSSTLGCCGVDFEESILRPYCVQKLYPHEVRLNQVVLRRELKQLVIHSGDLNYQHHWKENEAKGLRGGFDRAESLLSQDDWKDILENRFQSLEMVDKVVTSKLTKGGSSSKEEDVHSNIGGQSFGDSSENVELMKYLQNEFRMLHTKLDQNHDEVKGILKGLKKDIMEKQEALYTKVCSNICALMEFSVQLIQSKVPKYPVFVPDATTNKLKQMIPGLTSGRLYFFCEHREGFHLAPQLGLSASHGTISTRKCGVVLFWGLTIIVMLLKIGAHLCAGMGDMVPYTELKAFMVMLDTPGLLDMAIPTGRMLEFLPADLKRDSTITKFDNEAAEDWLVGYVKSKCGTGSGIQEKLGLHRVVYVDHNGEKSESTQLVAWICNEHLEQGKKNGTLRSLGNSF